MALSPVVIMLAMVQVIKSIAEVAEKYKTAFEELLSYTEKHFVDKENPEWYGYLHYDNTPSTTLKGNIFKGLFRIPRSYMVMEVMDRTNGISEFMK